MMDIAWHCRTGLIVLALMRYVDLVQWNVDNSYSLKSTT